MTPALGVSSSSRVLDLGAGSGILTRQLRPLVGALTAVEPAPGMRDTFRASTPDVEILDGRDTAIPLASDSLDAIFVAQAFHWFDPEPALVEMHRVLVAGGGLALLWNERDETVAWVRDLGAAMRWPEFQPYQVGRDFRADVRAGPFDRVARARFDHVQTLTHAQLIDRVLTTSYIAVMEPDERAVVLEDVRRVIAPLPEMLDLPYVTDTYSAFAT